MTKLLKLAFTAVASVVLTMWMAFIGVRHADGDIILTSDHGWNAPHVRPVLYSLLTGEGRYKEIWEQGYWYGGDVIFEGVPDWVIIIPCPRWMGSLGGDWYGAREGYSRWIPNNLSL